jgi:hypothetical protein
MIFYYSLLGSRTNLAVEPDRRASSISSRGTLATDSDRRLSAMSTISEDFLLPAKKKPSTISGKRFSLSSGSFTNKHVTLINLNILTTFDR